MAKIRHFHYSSKEYEPGDIITQELDHYGRLVTTQPAAEDELRPHSSEAAEKRATSVYAWELRKAAENGWNYRKGTHLYEIEVEENDVRHIGDIGIFTAIETALRKKETVDVLRRDYWEGKRIGGRIEVLASKATIVRKLKDSSERLTPTERAIRKQRGCL